MSNVQRRYPSFYRATHRRRDPTSESRQQAYQTYQVFDDKPGVGWMLYLPKLITAQQVPEARELISVPEAGRLHTGTIIVSLPDAVFSVSNSEHVEIANRIEIRLVDQNLLPAFADL
ncbi:immunity 52 family protein [Burkholderia ambifaria]|nr:immunity 52 family protein [Burkholderia ambifaria]